MAAVAPAANSPNAKQKKKPTRPSKPIQVATTESVGGAASKSAVWRAPREDALRHGNPAAAADYAERAVKAAPQDNKLWFLLGYTSRLAGRYQTSIDAYQHGLQTSPGNADGMCGLAQTYARWAAMTMPSGCCSQVIRDQSEAHERSADRSANSYLRTGDTQQGINLLQRAEASAAERACRVDDGGGLSEAEAAREGQADARPGEEARAEQCRDLPGGGQLLPRRTRLQSRDHYPEERAAKMTPSVLADLGYTYELEGDKEKAAAGVCSRRERQAERDWIPAQRRAGSIATRQSSKRRVQYLNRAAAIDPESLSPARHSCALWQKKRTGRPTLSRNTKRRSQRMPAGGVPEGQLYPVQLRLNLAELYRESGDDEAAHQQLAMAEQEINKLNVQGTAKAEFLRVRASHQDIRQRLEGRGSRPG